MSRDSVPVTIQIMGNDYRISCPEREREALTEAGSHLDAKMQEIRNTGKAIGVERVAVIAALNISYELLKLKADIAQHDAQVHYRLEALLDEVQIALRNSAEMEV